MQHFIFHTNSPCYILKNSKNWDFLSDFHNRLERFWFCHAVLRSCHVDGMANSANPDQIDLCFHCLFSLVCPNT